MGQAENGVSVQAVRFLTIILTISLIRVCIWKIINLKTTNVCNTDIGLGAGACCNGFRVLYPTLKIQELPGCTILFSVDRIQTTNYWNSIGCCYSYFKIESKASFTHNKCSLLCNSHLLKSN